MNIVEGSLYFIKDQFFQEVNDPYLKINYETTKRPHYFAVQDIKTSLYWLVPCSSKVEKFEQILQSKKDQHKPTDTIKIVIIQNKKMVLLFQDMFPIVPQYIDGQYIRGGQAVRIADPKVIADLEKTAKKVIKLIRLGVKFTPTQPDANRIERAMQKILQNSVLDGLGEQRMPLEALQEIINKKRVLDTREERQCPSRELEKNDKVR